MIPCGGLFFGCNVREFGWWVYLGVVFLTRLRGVWRFSTDDLGRIERVLGYHRLEVAICEVDVFCIKIMMLTVRKDLIALYPKPKK